jgi:regulator of sigma E protease
VLFVHGVPGLKPVLGEVRQDTPAAAAQMQPGETILSIGGVAIPSWQELRWTLLEQALQQSEVKIEGRSAQGELLTHMLDMRGLQAKDLDGEFLDKLGLQLYRPIEPPIVGKIAEGSAAQQAGLQAGDVILSANAQAIKHWDDLVGVLRNHPGQAVSLDIRRGELSLNITVVPQAVQKDGKTIGQIGISSKINKAAWEAMLIEVSYNPLDALGQALRKTWETSIISLKMLGKMILGEVSMKNLSGPITIADYAGQSAEMGLTAYLGFLALISVSLGVLNLLPIPLLDGGHLLYYAAELAKGSPVSEQAWELGQRIGIALLGTLMLFAIYNDITRLISG